MALFWAISSGNERHEMPVHTSCHYDLQYTNEREVKPFHYLWITITILPTLLRKRNALRKSSHESNTWLSTCVSTTRVNDVTWYHSMWFSFLRFRPDFDLIIPYYNPDWILRRGRAWKKAVVRFLGMSVWWCLLLAMLVNDTNNLREYSSSLKKHFRTITLKGEIQIVSIGNSTS